MTISAPSAPTSLAACRYSIACATLLLDHAALLFRRHGRAFARGSARDQSVAAFSDLPFNQLAERVLGDTTIRKRRNQRRNRAKKHELASVFGRYSR